MGEAEARKWLASAFAPLAPILRYDHPTLVRNARNPFLVPHALFLKLQNMFYFWQFEAESANEFGQAFDMGFSDALVEENSSFCHAASLSR